MYIRTSSCIASSLKTAAFQTILVRDRRGLTYRIRREIMTLRRLRQDPFPVNLPFPLRGYPHTNHNIRDVVSSGTKV